MQLLFQPFLLSSVSLFRHCTSLFFALRNFSLHLHLKLVFQNLGLEPQIFLFFRNALLLTTLLRLIAHFKEIRHVFLQVLHNFAGLFIHCDLEPCFFKYRIDLAADDFVANRGLLLNDASLPLNDFLPQDLVIKWRINDTVKDNCRNQVGFTLLFQFKQLLFRVDTSLAVRGFGADADH